VNVNNEVVQLLALVVGERARLLVATRHVYVHIAGHVVWCLRLVGRLVEGELVCARSGGLRAM
jgi:hypothetical protein